MKTWFSYQASVHNSHQDGSDWFRILKHIHQQATSKPCCCSIPQQFALENPKVVDAKFTQHYGEGRDLTPVQRMNSRNELAKSLVNTTYKHLADNLEKCAKEAHEREMSEWGLNLDNIGEAEDVQL